MTQDAETGSADVLVTREVIDSPSLGTAVLYRWLRLPRLPRFEGRFYWGPVGNAAVILAVHRVTDGDGVERCAEVTLAPLSSSPAAERQVGAMLADGWHVMPARSR